MRAMRDQQHGDAEASCRATAMCRRVLRATTCRFLLSCLPSLPVAFAPGIVVSAMRQQSQRTRYEMPKTVWMACWIAPC